MIYRLLVSYSVGLQRCLGILLGKKNPNQKHYQIWSLSEPCIFRTVHLSFMKLLCLRYFVTVMKSWLIVSGKNSHRADIDTFFMYIFDNID